jgi:hypothetical protein
MYLMYNVDGQHEHFQFYFTLNEYIKHIFAGGAPLREFRRSRSYFTYYFLSEDCFLNVAVLSLRGALSDERSVISPSESVVIYQYLHQEFTLHVFYSSAIYIQYEQSFIHSLLSTAG